MTKNILIVASKFPPEYSGPGVRIIRLYEHFKKQGNNFSVQVFCNGIEHQKNEIYTYNGLKVRRVSEKFFSGIFRTILSNFPRLKTFALYQIEFLKSFITLLSHKEYKKMHMLHIFGNSGGTAAALLFANTYKIPILMELVTAQAQPQQKIFGFLKVSPHKKSCTIALTNKAEKRAIAAGYPAPQIWCRPNPIDENIFNIETDKKLQFRQELSPFTQNDIVLSSVAKFMPQKNQRFIIDIMKCLPPKYKALIAGPLIKDGPLYKRDLEYLKTIQDEIDKHDLQDRIHLQVSFVEAHQYMKASDIYLLPAWDEGFGTPMMEALACGLPVIANKNEYAFQEWIQDGRNGYLCNISTPEEWAQSIEKAAQFSEQHKLQFSQNIIEKSGKNVIYKQYEKIIEQLLDT